MSMSERLHRIAEEIKSYFPGHAAELHETADEIAPTVTDPNPPPQIGLDQAEEEVAALKEEEVALLAEPTETPPSTTSPSTTSPSTTIPSEAPTVAPAPASDPSATPTT